MPKSEEFHLLDKQLRLLQPAEGFRTSIDTVLLAAACPARNKERILDLGCGVGSAGLCVLHRTKETDLQGLDINEDMIEFAHKNAALNSMAERTKFEAISVNNYTERIKGRNVNFDHVICNPPYLESGTHIPSPVAGKAQANAQNAQTTLADWIACAHHALKPGGVFTIIQRADQTDLILKAMGDKFGETQIIPLWPMAGRPARRVILRGRKNRKGGATLHPGLVLHQENGDYTAETENILRGRAVIE